MGSPWIFLVWGNQDVIPGSLLQRKSLFKYLLIYVVEFIYRVA